MTSFRRLAAALLLASPLLATGCGGDSQQVVRSDDLSPAAAVAAAAEKSLAAETQRMTMEIALDGESITSMVGEGTADGTTFRGTMTMPPMGDVEYLVVDRAMYYAFPDLPEGKAWVKMSYDDMAGMGMDMDAASQQQGNQALGMLAAAGAEVEEVGSDDVAGTSTTRYRAVVDPRKAFEANDVVSGEMADQALSMLGESLTMDVWIDADGFARRIEYAIDLAEASDLVPGMPSEGEISYVFEMSDFGEPVDVVAPPESEVISFDEFGASMRGALGEFNAVGEGI